MSAFVMLTEREKRKQKLRVAIDVRTHWRISLKYWERIEKKLVREQNKLYQEIVVLTKSGHSLCESEIDAKLQLYIALTDQLSTAGEEAVACQDMLYKMDNLISICKGNPL